ncbi:GlsB/YeaQ/YmgE family stress response membrane protein, partial [Frankia sp. CNm7]|uniref:GlsB/YeaQ/YmgE family stress response membrane protein n=1 Tax=Frankia nepalensis TaxID=1836974 RepID=UPI001934A6C1
MIWTIVSWIVLGLVAGALARLLVPGPDPMSILSTVLLGVAGSFVGGFLGYALFDKDLGEGALQPSGIVGSILGAIVLVLLRRVFTRRR